MTNIDKLHAAFAAGLHILPGRVTDDLSYETIPEWDSIGHMSLVAELESSFDVMLDTEEIVGLNSVAKSKEILSRHGVAF